MLFVLHCYVFKQHTPWCALHSLNSFPVSMPTAIVAPAQPELPSTLNPHLVMGMFQ